MPRSDETYEEERIRKENIEPLDRSASSGQVGGEQKVFDDETPSEHRDTPNRTKWSDRETPDETVERFGNEMDKWEWLKRLNKGDGYDEIRGENRERGRENDFRLLVDQLDNLAQWERKWLHNECCRVFEEITEERKEGDNFGATRPTEVTEIAILTYAARRLTDVEDLSDIDMSDGVNNVAFGGSQVADLCEKWPPTHVDTSVETIRDVRGKISTMVDND